MVLGFVVACGGPAPSGDDLRPAESPGVSVERFLHAANQGDLDAMSRIFGTADGAIIDQAGGTLRCGFRRIGSWIRIASRCPTEQDIELRMDAIARVLEHEAFEIVSEDRVAGRQNPTVRVSVTVERRADRITDVPFVAVQAGDGRWMIEEIGLERLTS